jgi:mRNA-degrading endonuclease RelE of RelBE toxin-antitoxin system
VYDIRLAESVEEDLGKIPVFYRNQILDAIGDQLAYAPVSPTKHRKLLATLIPPWEAVLPVWELRVGEYRVFYDVSEEQSMVYVRAVRRKPRGKKTEDIL